MIAVALHILLHQEPLLFNSSSTINATLLAAFQSIDPLALKPSSFHVAIWTLIAQSVAHIVVVGPLPQSLVVRELLLQNKDSVQDIWQIILSGH